MLEATSSKVYFSPCSCIDDSVISLKELIFAKQKFLKVLNGSLAYEFTYFLG